MPRSRKASRSTKKGDRRIAALIVGGLIAVSLIVNLLERHPVLGTLGLLLACVCAGSLIWRRRQGASTLRWKAHTLGDLLTLSPTGFEEAVGTLYRGLGFR